MEDCKVSLLCSMCFSVTLNIVRSVFTDVNKESQESAPEHIDKHTLLWP